MGIAGWLFVLFCAGAAVGYACHSLVVRYQLADERGPSQLRALDQVVTPRRRPRRSVRPIRHGRRPYNWAEQSEQAE